MGRRIYLAGALALALTSLAACEAEGPEPPDEASCTLASHGAQVCGGTAIYRCAEIDGTYFEWLPERDCQEHCEDRLSSCLGGEEYVAASCEGDGVPACTCTCRRVPGAGR